jgi:hypothetical protein
MSLLVWKRVGTGHTVEEGNEFVAGALWSEGESDGVEALDGVEPEGDVVVTELVDEDGDRVELYFRIHDADVVVAMVAIEDRKLLEVFFFHSGLEV